MKPDEALLLATLARERPRQSGDGFATDVATRLGIHPKRAEYLLDKWVSKGWFECGVSLRSGWLTEAGLAAAQSPEFLPAPVPPI